MSKAAVGPDLASGTMPLRMHLRWEQRAFRLFLGAVFLAVCAVIAFICVTAWGADDSGTLLFLGILAAAFAGFGTLFARTGLSNVVHLCLDTAGLRVRNWRTWDVKWAAVTSIEMGQGAGARKSVNLGIWIRYRRRAGSPAGHFIEDLFTLLQDALFQAMLDRHAHEGVGMLSEPVRERDSVRQA